MSTFSVDAPLGIIVEVCVTLSRQVRLLQPSPEASWFATSPAYKTGRLANGVLFKAFALRNWTNLASSGANVAALVFTAGKGKKPQV